MNLSLGVKGSYELEIVRGDGSNEQYAFDNLLLNSYVTRWSSSANSLGNAWYCHVGSGTTPVTVTDTQLAGYIATCSTSGATSNGSGVTNYKDGADYWTEKVHTFTFTVGQVVGTVAEVGISPDLSHTTITSRALIKDTSNNPITLTLTVNDQLVVRYRLRYRIPTTQVSSIHTIDGVSTTVTWECLNALQTKSWSLYCLSNSVFGTRPGSCDFSNSTLRNNPELGSTGFNGAASPSTHVYTEVSPGVRRHTFTIPSTAIPTAGSTFTYLAIDPGNSLNVSGDISIFGLHFSPAVTKTNNETITISYEVTLTRL